MNARKNTLVISHGKCIDGFSSAVIAHKALGPEEANFMAGFYHQPVNPSQVEGRDVLFLDFCFKRSLMEQLCAKARSVTILDHHKTAQADCQPLIDSGALKGRFDMDESGATMAWKHFFPDQEVPEAVAYVRDRDIFRLEMPESEMISRVIGSYPFRYTIPNLTRWWSLLTSTEEMAAIKQEVVPIKRLVGSLVELYYDYTRYMTLTINRRRYAAALCNCPNFMSTELGEMIKQRNRDVELVLMWNQVADTVQFSVRGAQGLDVSEIAKEFGGGGHAGASGFSSAMLEKQFFKALSNLDDARIK